MLRYSENNRYQFTTGKRSCKSCSSSTAAWNNVTGSLDYDNVTTSKPSKVYTYRGLPSSVLIAHKIRKAVISIVPPLSLVSNSMSIAVFLRMRRKIQKELVLVFISLSVVDTFALSLRFNDIMLYISRKAALMYYDVGCQLIYWLHSCGQVCSSYLVLLYTFERFISVRYPLKRAIICSERRVRMAVLCILVFIPVSQIYYLYFYISPGISCGVRRRNRLIFGYLQLYINFVLGLLLPYSCVAILNAMIVYHMIKYQRKRAALQASTTSSEERMQKSMTIMLFSASTYSFVMMAPLFFSRAINVSNVQNNIHTFLFYYVSLNIIAPWNYCGNFFFYFIGGRQFRKEVIDMLRCRQRRGKCIASNTVQHSIMVLRRPFPQVLSSS